MRVRTVAVAALAAVAVGAAVVEAAPESEAPAVLEFIATDFAFSGPTRSAAGYATVRMVNRGQELHHITLIRIAEGKTLHDLREAMAAGATALPGWAVAVGGPSAAAPGQTIETSLLLKEGRYALLCVIPSADGVMHAMKGMQAELVVEGPGPGAPAATDGEMILRDYAFLLSKPLHSGTQTIRVRTEAEQDHEVLFVRLEPGRTAHDFLAWVEDPSTPPPGVPLGGVAALAPGEWNDITLSLEPGRHALLCFIPDKGDGQPHFVHGMVMEVDVK